MATVTYVGAPGKVKYGNQLLDTGDTFECTDADAESLITATEFEITKTKKKKKAKADAVPAPFVAELEE